MTWLIVTIELLIGIAILAWAADRFIMASAAIARRFGMSSLMIGMLLVGFGTSFPELVVSMLASLQGKGGLSVGNALGSNIINITLVIGLSAVIVPLKVHSSLLKREYPIMVLVAVVVGILFWDGQLSRIDGLILVAILALHLYWMFFMVPKRDKQKDVMVQEYQTEIDHVEMPYGRALFWWFLGLALLFGSSELLVHAAVTIAKMLKVSDLVIGLTVVATGTSLPELAASIMSALRKEHDIAVGNVVGSNIFNLLGVLAMPALISPLSLPKSLFHRDYILMMVFILAMWFLSYTKPNKGQLGRPSGVIFLSGFVIYLVILLITVHQ